MIVFNPEIKAKYNEEGNFLKNIMRDVSVDKKVVLNGSFIIEKDGTTSHIEILNSSDVKIDSIVKKLSSEQNGLQRYRVKLQYEHFIHLG